ncbi:enoyl-CoA hydratase-related protein [Defluviimonas sp. WL0002]|uniref:Enoyl-CoA hydratase-related protein n=1 Tax=Albidovulum marisflavi TaxID=2984159 RepID=A0ABT2ZGD7_9RHOB|nr:enoyl-CoA hydratase-related protein [Defluviimonas sp. WL0002]MCV2870194.1 enoyl-CoA hydratase-related protein [Defluviimonas sp. WL0002]
MAELVRAVNSDGIALLRIVNPPLNLLSQPVRVALLAALEAAEADPSVEAIVLAAEGPNWSAGEDIKELDLPATRPSLSDVCDAVAASLKPVAAAMRGSVSGGGLELALAAGTRVASADARFGFPWVALGMAPGAGGTQRAPRLIGARAALELMLGGQMMSAQGARAAGLIDAVSDDAVSAAKDIARAMAGGAPPPVRPATADGVDRPGAYLAAVAEARAALRDTQTEAPARIMECIEAAALLPEAEGYEFERVAYEELRASPEAAALRHLHQAERRLLRNPDLGAIEIAPRRTVALAGETLVVADLARDLLHRGWRVTLFDPATEILTRTIGLVAARFEHDEAQGRMSAAARQEAWARFDGATEFRDLQGVDVVCDLSDLAGREAEARMAEFGRVAAEGAILATSATGPNLDKAIAVSRRPAAVVGLRPAGPETSRLFEIAASRITDREILAAVLGLLVQSGRSAVRTGLGSGSLGEHLFGALRFAADTLLEEGASPYQVDAVMVAQGWHAGPYAALDRQGLISDLEWRARLEAEEVRPLGNAGIGLALLELGRGGVATGAGYYRHEARDGEPVQDPDVLRILAEHRGGPGRTISAQEIRTRLGAALANEGARLIEEGLARRPSDIDIVAILGMGAPRTTGGPMHAAERAGLLTVRNVLRKLAQGRDERFWRPAAIWDEMIRSGRRFADLNGA